MTQEIIVYRNPGEKAIWDMLGTAEAFIVIAAFLGGAAFAWGFLALNSSFRVIHWRQEGNVALAIWAVCSIVIGFVMW